MPNVKNMQRKKPSQILRYAIESGIYCPYEDDGQYVLTHPAVKSTEFMCKVMDRLKMVNAITETQWYLLTADITREIDFEITLISYLFRKCNGPRADHLTGHYPSPEARIEFYAGFIHRLELHGL